MNVKTTQQHWFLAVFERTGQPSRAALEAGVTWVDVFRWYRESSQFAAAYDKIETDRGNEGTRDQHE